jgi:hypothetical protein
LLGCFDTGACSCLPQGALFVIAAKLRLASLLYACAAGGYFFRGFTSVGDAALSVPCRGCRRDFCRAWWRQSAAHRLPARIFRGTHRRGDRLGRPLLGLAYILVQPLTCSSGCGVWNCGEASPLCAALRLRGGRLLLPGPHFCRGRCPQRPLSRLPPGFLSGVGAAISRLLLRGGFFLRESP